MVLNSNRGQEISLAGNVSGTLHAVQFYMDAATHEIANKDDPENVTTKEMSSKLHRKKYFGTD